MVLGLFPDDYTADPDRTFRQLADDLDTDPSGVIELLNANARAPR
jgi:hypothetical protein